MSIYIGEYECDDPHECVADLEERPGLYAVLRY